MSNLRFIWMYIILFMVFAIPPSFAQEERVRDPNYIFYKANTFYEEAKYDDAIREYGKLIDQGYEGGNLYYNIGNCYFKKGEPGRAILNYERAKRFIPHDSDLKSNYEYARSLIEDKMPEMKTRWPFRLLKGFSGYFTMDGLTLFSSILYIAAICILIIRIFFKAIKRYVIYLISIIILIFILTIVSLGVKINNIDKEAIIVTESIDSRFEPFERATIHFILYEGTKVYVLKSKDDWYKIKRMDGKVGWVKRSALELI